MLSGADVGGGWQWDEAKHPQRRPLKETVDNLGATIVQLEDDLKVSHSERHSEAHNHASHAHTQLSSPHVSALSRCLLAHVLVACT
jgi:hypothetical protein